MSKTIKQLLTQNNIDQLDAELLISYVLKKPREWVLTHLDYQAYKLASLQVGKLFKKRQRGIPLAYLTGHKEFFGLDFFVNKNVLIPRPDTEVLVESVLERIGTYDIGHRTILVDVGTGSGCIPISIIKTLKHSARGGSVLVRKNIKTFAIDISSLALRIAKKNAQKHNVKIDFLHGNLLSPILNSSELRTPNSKLIVTANLPYITEKQFQEEPSIQKEPKLALVAEDQGLALYKKLLEQIQSLLTAYGLRLTAFFEIDPSQSQKIKPLIKKHLPNAKIEIKKDLAGLDRVVVIEIK